MAARKRICNTWNLVFEMLICGYEKQKVTSGVMACSTIAAGLSPSASARTTMSRSVIMRTKRSFSQTGRTPTSRLFMVSATSLRLVCGRTTCGSSVITSFTRITKLLSIVSTVCGQHSTLSQCPAVERCKRITAMQWGRQTLAQKVYRLATGASAHWQKRRWYSCLTRYAPIAACRLSTTARWLNGTAKRTVAATVPQPTKGPRSQDRR